MKRRFVFLVVLCCLLLPSCSSKGKEDNETADNEVVNNKIDYTSCPYIGVGSHYIITKGTTDNYMSIHFWFDPDGVGAWGSYRYEYGEETKEVHEFDFRLFGEVNISYILRENNKEGGKGYFTTDTTGQVFVCEGLRLSRYS